MRTWPLEALLSSSVEKTVDLFTCMRTWPLEALLSSSVEEMGGLVVSGSSLASQTNRRASDGSQKWFTTNRPHTLRDDSSLVLAGRRSRGTESVQSQQCRVSTESALSSIVHSVNTLSHQRKT